MRRWDSRRDKRVLQVVFALYRHGPMTVKRLAEVIADASGEKPENVRRVLYRILPWMKQEGIIDWSPRSVSLTAAAKESMDWIMDCLEVRTCRALLRAAARQDPRLLAQLVGGGLGGV